MLGIDLVVDKFVQEHVLLVAGTALSVFATGFTAGRFFFQGLLDTHRAEAELFKNQRDEATARLQEAQHVVTERDKRSELQIKAIREEARVKAVSRFLSSLATILLLSLVGYSIHLQTLIIRGAVSDSSRDVEFQKQTEASFRALQPRPVIQRAVDAPKQPKKKKGIQATPDAEK